jgi:hypothetical protein
MINQDFKDLLATFNEKHVEYLVVGGHALAAHGLVRATKDLDVWIRPATSNAPRVIAALASFGAPLHDLCESDLVSAGTIFQIGVPPVRIDIITAIDGVTFDEAWPARIQGNFGDQTVPVISWNDLIRNKRSAGRPQDLLDVRWLESHPPKP